MSERLEDRISRWVEEVDRRHTPVTVEELSSMPELELTRRVVRARRIPGPAMGLAALAIALLTVGGIGLFRGLTDDVSPASPSAPPASSPDIDPTEPDVSVASLLDAEGWSQVGRFEGTGGVTTLSSVASSGSVLTAVGAEVFVGSGSPTRVPALWTSRDGIVWTRIGADDAAFQVPQLSGALHDVVGFGSRLVAAGSFDCEAAIWVSDDDGATWSRIPNQDAIFGVPGIESSCADGSLSIGHLVRVGDEVFAVDPDNQIVWASADGVSWRRVSADAPFGPGRVEIDLVSAGGPGLVATGIGCEEPAGNAYYVSCGQTVWTSADGSAWTRVSDEGRVLGNAEINDLAEAGPGLIAVGAVLGGDANSASVWTSVDGVSWTRQELSAEEGVHLTTVLAITASEDHLIAVGSGLYCSSPGAAVEVDAAWSCTLGDGNAGVLRPFTPVWVSSDGLSWERQSGIQSLPFFDAGSATELLDVLAIDEGLLAVGWGPDTSLPNTSENRFSSVFLWRSAE